MKVAVLGDGLLGQSLFDWSRATALEVTVFGHADLDVVQPETLGVLREYDVAINTVAFHRLMECERDATMARLVNAEGAHNVAAILPTVYISTDYVFNDKGPHDESLPGETPRSVYGQTKLAGELATLEAGGIVVRVAGLYGRYPSHKGASFPEAVTSSYAPMRLPNDQRFSPTYADDAAGRIARLAIELASWHHEGTRPEGVYHAANAGSTSWYEFAENILEVTGHKRKLDGFRSHDTLRPTNSVLKSTRLAPLRHWRLALADWAEWRAGELRGKRVSPLREGVPWTPVR